MNGLGDAQRVTRLWTRRRNGNAALADLGGASRPDSRRRARRLRLELVLGTMDGALRTRARTGADRVRSVWTRSPLADSYGRLAPVLVPVSVAGLAVLAVAASTLPTTVSAADVLGIIVLIAGAWLAEAFPVPIELEGVAAGGVSLAAVFIVGAAIIYGWATAVVVAFVALGVVQALHRRGATRLLYNGSVYALGALAAGLAAAPVVADESIRSLVAGVTVGGLAFYAVNVALIAAVVARVADERFLALVRRSIRSTAIPFSIMASVSLTLTVLWDHSPLLSLALVGPLVAVAL